MSSLQVRMLCLFLCLGMVIGVFAGCSQATQITPSSSTAPPTTTATPTTLAEEPHTLKVLVCSNYQYVKEITGTPVFRAFCAMCQEKKLSLEWIAVDAESYDQTIADILAGTAAEIPDAIWLGDYPTADLVTAAEIGQLTSIDEILAYSDGGAAARFHEDSFFHRRNGVNGQLYWFGVDQTTEDGQTIPSITGAPIGVLLREDWITALNSDIPDTVEELEGYMQYCMENDLNNSDHPDTYFPTLIYDITSGGLNSFYGVPVNHFAVDLQSGEVTAAWEAPGAKELIQTYRRWFSLGYFPEDLYGGSSGMTKYINGNKCALSTGAFNDNSFAKRINSLHPDVSASFCGILPELSAHPNAYILKATPTDLSGNCLINNMAFTSHLQDKRAAAILMDLLVSPEFDHLMQWGVEGETYYVYDGIYRLRIEDYQDICINYTIAAYPGRYYIPDTILPWVNEPCAQPTEEFTSQLAEEQYRLGLNAPLVYCDNQEPYLAVPTTAEAETLASIEGNYISLSKEIFYKLLYGEIDIETQWESHVMEPLRQAGMEQLKAVYQDRADRVFA